MQCDEDPKKEPVLFSEGLPRLLVVEAAGCLPERLKLLRIRKGLVLVHLTRPVFCPKAPVGLGFLVPCSRCLSENMARA